MKCYIQKKTFAGFHSTNIGYAMPSVEQVALETYQLVNLQMAFHSPTHSSVKELVQWGGPS